MDETLTTQTGDSRGETGHYLSKGGLKVLSSANKKWFSKKYDYPVKARITEGQAAAILESWLEEYIPWWVDDPTPEIPDSFKQALDEIDPDICKPKKNA